MDNKSQDKFPFHSLPKVSVVSVSYQSKDVVEATLLSILNLDYPSIELIVVDNCSTDGTELILQKYASQIHQLIIEKDKGPYDAMNKAIQKCTGDWIWFMNMGDLVPNQTQLLREVFQRNISSNTLVLYGNTCVKRGALTYQKIFSSFIDGNFRHGVLSLNHQSTFIKKQAFEKFGLYDFEHCPIKADALWFTQLYHKLGANAFEYLPLELAVYNEEGLSSNAANFSKMIKEDRFILKHYGSVLNLMQLKWHAFFLSLRVWGLSLLEKNEGLYQTYRSLKYRNSHQIKNLPKE